MLQCLVNFNISGLFLTVSRCHTFSLFKKGGGGGAQEKLHLSRSGGGEVREQSQSKLGPTPHKLAPILGTHRGGGGRKKKETIHD